MNDLFNAAITMAVFLAPTYLLAKWMHRKSREDWPNIRFVEHFGDALTIMGVVIGLSVFVAAGAWIVWVRCCHQG
jgi:divalent metal cation (Fe/Co/Zn/Cd) transporter